MTREELVSISGAVVSKTGNVALRDIIRIRTWTKTVELDLRALTFLKSLLFTYGFHQSFKDQKRPVSANATPIFQTVKFSLKPVHSTTYLNLIYSSAATPILRKYLLA